MLFQQYMDAKAEDFERHVDQQFSQGSIYADSIKAVGTGPMEQASEIYEVAEWFESVHDDDLDRTHYRLIDEADPEFSAVPRTQSARDFIERVRMADREDNPQATTAWSDDAKTLVMVFEDDPTFPEYPADPHWS